MESLGLRLWVIVPETVVSRQLSAVSYHSLVHRYRYLQKSGWKPELL